jgi:hypothetical protein
VEASYLFVFDKSNSNVKEDYHSKMGTNINQDGNDHLKEVQMKTSMMKLSVFVMMAAIAMFTLVAMASADDHKWKHGIKGDYAVTGTNSCVTAPAGFGDGGDPGDGWTTIQGYLLGVFSFHPDGKGEFRSKVAVSLQPTPQTPMPPVLFEAPFDYNFTYKVTGDGVISFHVIPCAGIPGFLNNDGPHDGVISPDGQSLIVYCSTSVILTQCYPGTCSGVGEGSCETPQDSPQLACAIQMQGFRIKKPFDPLNIEPCPE